MVNVSKVRSEEMFTVTKTALLSQLKVILTHGTRETIEKLSLRGDIQLEELLLD